MRIRRGVVVLMVACAHLLASGASPATSASAQAGAEAPPRIVAVGDVHGAYDQLLGILRATDVVDDAGSWSGGETILVQTGDFTDRGAGTRSVMDLLMRLQIEAPEAGGRVLVALGNHEVLNLIGEFRDVTPEIMAAFVDDDSEKTRDDAFDELADNVLRDEDAWSRATPRQRRQIEQEWAADHPLGYVEYVRAMGPSGVYGRWIRQLPAIITVQGLLFMHAGVVPRLAGLGVDGLNARVAAEVKAFDAYRARLLDERRITSFANLAEVITGAARATRGLDWLPAWDADLRVPPPLLPDIRAANDERDRYQALFYLDDWYLNAPGGPLWFRGYANWDEATGVGMAAALLTDLKARALVVGHTPQPSGIRARFGGKVFLIDTGMLQPAYHGKPMALEIRGNDFAAIGLDGSRTALPAPPLPAETEVGGLPQ